MKAVRGSMVRPLGVAVDERKPHRGDGLCPGPLRISQCSLSQQGDQESRGRKAFPIRRAGEKSRGIGWEIPVGSV